MRVDVGGMARSFMLTCVGTVLGCMIGRAQQGDPMGMMAAPFLFVALALYFAIRLMYAFSD